MIVIYFTKGNRLIFNAKSLFRQYPFSDERHSGKGRLRKHALKGVTRISLPATGKNEMLQVPRGHLEHHDSEAKIRHRAWSRRLSSSASIDPWKDRTGS
jgi:hypothetical protein